MQLNSVLLTHASVPYAGFETQSHCLTGQRWKHNSYDKRTESTVMRHKILIIIHWRPSESCRIECNTTDINTWLLTCTDKSAGNKERFSLSLLQNFHNVSTLYFYNIMSVTVTIPDCSHDKSPQVKSSVYILGVLGHNSEPLQQCFLLVHELQWFWLKSIHFWFISKLSLIPLIWLSTSVPSNHKME
jgi:hypothetical protein